MRQLREDQSTGETLENKMTARFQIKNGSAGHNVEMSTADDDQEEEEECRTEAHWKALVIVAKSDRDEL